MIKTRKWAASVFKDRLLSLDVELAEATKVWIRFQECSEKYEGEEICGHCGKTVSQGYMLKNEVWGRVWESKKGFLHLKCVEERLGRLLTVEDFKECWLNGALLYFLKERS